MPEKRSLWVTRAGKKGEAEPLFFGENVVALGWSEMGDLSTLPDDRDAFKSRMTEACDTVKPNAIPVCAGQLYRFVYERRLGTSCSRRPRRVISFTSA
jgi:restriction system protein